MLCDSREKGPSGVPLEIDRQSPEIALILRCGNAFKSPPTAQARKITSTKASIAMTSGDAYVAP